MTARANVGVLRQAAVDADGDGCQIVYPRPLAYPGVIANREAPGEFHTYARLDDDTAADAGAKELQDEAPMCGAR